MSIKLTHFHDRATGELTELEVVRQQWFVLGDHESLYTAGVLELADGTVRTAHVYREGAFYRRYENGEFHEPLQYVVSGLMDMKFGEVAGEVRDIMEPTFEHGVTRH